ncbi:hypothetical protein FAVG1_02532 [Fusarium avenaceum]|nr:hypothetical protein FAVG1_02532 [Fusarium avenaceum]
MRVKFQLGLQYIWVDQLCIDQRDAEDMSCQLSQMNTIYNQASVTIVAAAGDSSSYGLPGVGQRPRTISNKFTLNGTTWKFRPELVKHQVGRSKWSTRGWTYQEAVFSRRCVIFADDQVFFQCGFFERMADENSDSQPYLPRGGRFMQDLKAYSKRELTYDFDVLRAMDGVSGFYAQLEPSVEQYWGLPLRWVGCVIPSEYYRTARLKHDDVVGAFLWAMLWKPAWSEVQSTKTGLAKRSGFPTWSWSGWKVEVTWSYLKNIKHLGNSFTVPLFVETATGGLVEFNKEFARSIASGQSYAALGLTHILTITTEVFDVPFIECAPYRHTPTLKRRDSFPIRYKGQH